MKYFLSLVFVLVSMLPGMGVWGYQEFAGDVISLVQDVEENVYAAGNIVTLSAKVEGDVVAAGNTISVKSPVTQDVTVA
jgi:hypothetical protein